MVFHRTRRAPLVHYHAVSIAEPQKPQSAIQAQAVTKASFFAAHKTAVLVGFAIVASVVGLGIASQYFVSPSSADLSLLGPPPVNSSSSSSSTAPSSSSPSSTGTSVSSTASTATSASSSRSSSGSSSVASSSSSSTSPSSSGVSSSSSGPPSSTGSSSVVSSSSSSSSTAVASSSSSSVLSSSSSSTSSQCTNCSISYFVTTQQGSKLIGTGYSNPPQFGPTALSADGNTLVVGGNNDDGTWVFTRSGSSWAPQGGKLTGGGAVGSPFQGYSVALSADGNTLATGGPNDGLGTFFNNYGAVWIMVRSGSTWTQQGSKLVGTGNNGTAGLGMSVALSADGNTLAVGGPNDNGGVGAVWIFVRSGSTWNQQGDPLVGTGNTGTSGQGTSVSLSADGNTLAVGAPKDNSTAGAVWIFYRSGTTWSQYSGGPKLLPSDMTGPVAQFGSSLALSANGTILVVGGPYDNYNSAFSSSTGAFWVFTYLDSVWLQYNNKTAGPNAGALFFSFGTGVAINADSSEIVASAPYYGSNHGAIFVYVKNAFGVYNAQGSALTGTGSTGAAEMGNNNQIGISASGNTVAVGGNYDNAQVGAVWVFV